MLKNLLRGVLSGELAQAPATNATPAPAPQAAVPAGPATVAPTDVPPAWHRLVAQAGGLGKHDDETGRPLVKSFFGHAPRRVLDVGCGGGAVGAMLKQAYPGLWVWGSEPGEDAAARAQERLDRVTTQPRSQWNAEDVALVGTVDTVLLLDVLQRRVNPWGELEWLATHLPADAQLIVSLPNAGHVSLMYQLAGGSFAYERTGLLDVTHLRFFTFNGMLRMFEDTGFRVEGSWILSRSPSAPIEEFPARVSLGNRVKLTIESPLQWDHLNAVEFGFRLRPGRR